MNKNEDCFPLLFKIIIVGESGVGKTCLLYQYTHNEYKPDYMVTIGVEFSSKIMKIDPNTTIKLQIWDTAGQESFRSVIKSFYRKASGIFLVYSIKNRESFEKIEFWLKEARENCATNQIFVLVGSQADLEDERKVTYEEGIKFMKDNNMNLFFETSAKSGENIEKAFSETAKLIFLNYINSEIKKNAQIINGKPTVLHSSESNKNSCC